MRKRRIDCQQSRRTRENDVKTQSICAGTHDKMRTRGVDGMISAGTPIGGRTRIYASWKWTRMVIIFSEITAGTHNDMRTRGFYSLTTAGTHNDMRTRGFHSLITAGTHKDMRTRRFPTRK